MKKIYTSCLCLFLLVHLGYSQVRVPKIAIEDFTGTKEQVATKITELENLITQAETAEIDVTKELMLISLARTFTLYANWDEKNTSIVAAEFDGLHTFHQTTPANLAEHLPTYERSELISLLDRGIETLTAVLDGTIVRQPVPQIDWSQISQDGNKLMHKGKPVFLGDYTWKEESVGSNDLLEYFGNYDGYFIDPAHVAAEDGTIANWITNQLAAKQDGTIGTMFVGHTRLPDWLKTKYPDIEVGAGLFTKYDIDNPGAREVITKLFAGTIPLMKGKNYTKQGYLLTNEPHWNLSGNWEVVALSEHSKDSLRAWLQTKHTSINDLNTLWDTSYTNFNEVNPPTLPIAQTEIGKPIWYDMMKFNQERVINWFSFMNDELVKHDPEAKTHIKLIPEMWSENARYQGLDFEALTNITFSIGNDAGAKNSWRWGGPFEWEDRYAFLWRELSMTYDFFRSIAPNKVNFNSESHFIQHVGFSDLFLEESYVRSVYWLATLQGMNATKSWFWPRTTTGALKNLEEEVGGSVVQQPRVAHEITSTFMDLNAHSEHISAMQHADQYIRIFYSETSAINKATHMDEVFELYEATYFEGTAVGFVTEKILQGQNNADWDVVLVHKTEFVTLQELAALQAYLDAGGTIITDAVSLKKDQYGRALTQPLTTTNGGTLLAADQPENFASMALALVSEKGHTPAISVSETNAVGKKGCVWRSYKSLGNENIVNIINIGKGEATVTIGLEKSTNAVICTNLLTGEKLDATFTMLPETVYLLSVKERTAEDNQFTIATTAETCPDQKNGQLTIKANTVQNFTALFNGTTTNFTDEITIDGIEPGTYELCIRTEGLATTNCYNLEIKAASALASKATILTATKKMAVEVVEGTGPFVVYVNDVEVFTTNESKFEVAIKQGDEVHVKTSIACEGTLSEKVDFLENLTVYPNPTTSIFEITIPVAIPSVPINMYTMQGQLLFSKKLPVIGGNVRIDIQDKPDGIYFVQVMLDKPVNVKVIKNNQAP